jgi:hypothetical protein
MASQDFAAPPPSDELKADSWCRTSRLPGVPVKHRFVWIIEQFRQMGGEFKSSIFTIRKSVSELSQF